MAVTVPSAEQVPSSRQHLVQKLHSILLASTLTLLIACGNGEKDSAQPVAAQPAAGTVDSIFPRDESMRRFRRDLPEVTTLSGGAGSREELERRFVKALEARDTTTLAALALTKAEFAWLYYPTVKSGMGETGLRPELMWLLLDSNSRKGLRVILAKLAGSPLPYDRHHCAEPEMEGDNRLWFPCVYTTAAAGDSVRVRLYGPIMERGGVYKFVGLANTLD